jgi:hypothetical protein
VLRPDDVIDLTVADVSGRPIDGRVSVMVSDYTPIIEVPRSGVTRGGVYRYMSAGASNTIS